MKMNDPHPVGAPDPFWRWCVRAGVQVFESHLCRKLAPHQYAIGVSNGAQRMGKATAFDAAQLPRHVWLPPDVKNAFMELDREENVKDMCMVHPMAFFRAVQRECTIFERLRINQLIGSVRLCERRAAGKYALPTSLRTHLKI